MQTKPTLDTPLPGQDIPQPSKGSPKSAGHPAPALTVDSPILKDVQVSLQAKLGAASLSLQDLLALKAGGVVKLDMKLNDLVELRLNDSLVARGEIVSVGEHFGVRIVEVGEVR